MQIIRIYMQPLRFYSTDRLSRVKTYSPRCRWRRDEGILFGRIEFLRPVARIMFYSTESIDRVESQRLYIGRLAASPPTDKTPALKPARLKAPPDKTPSG